MRLQTPAGTPASVNAVMSQIAVDGGQTRIVAKHRRDIGNVIAALDQAFAGVERFEAGHLCAIALEGIGDPIEDGAAFLARCHAPRAIVESFAGREHGGDRIVCAGFCDRRGKLTRCGAGNLPGLAIGSIVP